MDQSKWFSSVSVQRGARRPHRPKVAARFFIEYPDHVGSCCRRARRAERRPPCAHAVFRISSNSAVHRQDFPLGLPTFRPFLRLAVFADFECGLNSPLFAPHGRTDWLAERCGSKSESHVGAGLSLFFGPEASWASSADFSLSGIPAWAYIPILHNIRHRACPETALRYALHAASNRISIRR
jgi:hypothetical protein